MTEQNEDGRAISHNMNGFRELMYNTMGGRFIVFSAVITSLVLGYRTIDSYLIKKPAPIEQRQVIGDEKADIYIERDGVKYFSHVDGREISDLIQK